MKADTKELKTSPENILDVSMHDWPNFKGEKSSKTIELSSK